MTRPAIDGTGSTVQGDVQARQASGGTLARLIPFVIFAGFLPLLTVVPGLVPLAPDVASDAAIEGYNPSTAWTVTVAWILLTTFAVACIYRNRPDVGWDGRAADAPAAEAGRAPILLLVAVAVAILLVYFPPILARSGPFIEDEIHLGALHRMVGGMQPYRDFEFLYGPLMLYVPYGWIRIFGYNLSAFYSFVALIEVASFVTLTALIWMLVRDRGRRIIALLVIGALAFNALVGPNWSVSRRIPALLALVVLAYRPTAIRNVLIAAALIAVQAAWSHDFGAASMIGALAILGLAAWHESPVRAFRAATVLVTTTAVMWAGIVWALLGDGFGDYLTEVRYLTSRFSAGEAGFAFYWTVNSLAIFLLISVVCVIVGRRLLKRAVRPAPGDYLLFGACLFLLVTLKSGLNRSDLWHLDATLLPLMLAVLAAGSRRLFTATKFERGVVSIAALVIGFTYAFGLLPSVSYLAQGWLAGATRGGTPEAAGALPITAAPALNLERYPADAPVRQIAEYFSAPARFGRPTAFYADAWSMPIYIGVYKADFINDDFLYGDERGERFRGFLEATPEALVVMRTEVFDRLFGLADSTAFPEHERRYQPTLAKRMASWLSTVHYRALDTEVAVKDERWRRTAGEYVRDNFHVAARIGPAVVLERNQE